MSDILRTIVLLMICFGRFTCAGDGKPLDPRTQLFMSYREHDLTCMHQIITAGFIGSVNHSLPEDGRTPIFGSNTSYNIPRPRISSCCSQARLIRI
jgi:hypothetical protein